ncbi:tRNA (adenosine(37)-N6)-threonylcarbamoyltransferase complex transferase subunit TsaD [bacterium]|nr:tRNA (adenosine(37)-N6)-threonylcarbamoyltransferase complex transferase subunit TsaD [bacterium]|tara:strand:+ start:411 stop:1592 length:1182 start_codon:yes stop_codon:yes gene_type:complete
MKIFAIETSCDETGIALVETTSQKSEVSIKVLSDSLLSQAMLHAEYGGVYPTLAKREHAKNLVPLTLEVLKKAKMLTQAETPEVPREIIGEIKEQLEREPELFVQMAMLLAQTKKPDIDTIAVTRGPGLEPALWVGVNFAKALSLAWGIPVVPINHMEGHVAAALATGSEGEYEIAPPKLPALALLISGGHTELVLINDWLKYEKIGSTRDDAVGEAFDKSARLLGLPYPGGPEISKLARAARDESLEQPYSLPRPMIDTDNLDFSFSGLKTAVRNMVQEIGDPTDEQKKQVARELEDAIAEVLVAKTKRAIDEYGIQTLIVSGGVSANTHIRSELEKVVQEYEDTKLFFPTPKLATDNGLMIAFAAAMNNSRDLSVQLDELTASGNLSLSSR